LPERGVDKSNADRLRNKEGIEVGNGLPTLTTSIPINQALEAAGFEVLEARDANRGMHSPHEITKP